MIKDYDYRNIINFCLACTLAFSISKDLYAPPVYTQPTQRIKEIHVLEIPVYVENTENVEEQISSIEEEIYNTYMEYLTDDNKEEWWKGYKIISDNYEIKPLTIYDVYSDKELKYLYQCVETEVYGASFDAKVNVANVVFNRIANDKFGNTIESVVTSPNQFSYFRTNISQSTIDACEYAFEIEDTTQGALFFHSGAYTDTFNGNSYIFTDDAGHHFY